MRRRCQTIDSMSIREPRRDRSGCHAEYYHLLVEVHRAQAARRGRALVAARYGDLARYLEDEFSDSSAHDGDPPSRRPRPDT